MTPPPTSPFPTPRPDPFPEADQTWELERLYKDLATVKGKRLKPVEKC